MAAVLENPRISPARFTDVLGVAKDGGMGVIGSNPDDRAFGFLAGNDLVFSQAVGVYGESDQQGVMGLSTGDSGTGVYGGNTNGDAAHGIGVRGETMRGVGVQGRSFGAGLAGKFIGNVEVTGELNVNRLQLNGSNLEQRIADLDAQVNGGNLQQRIIDLEGLVNKLISFMDRTKDQPPARFSFNPEPLLRSLQGSHVVGQGFLPNTILTIRVTTELGFRDEKPTRFPTDANGEFEIELDSIFPRNKILERRLFVAVTDGRPNPFDWTGLLWANRES